MKCHEVGVGLECFRNIRSSVMRGNSEGEVGGDCSVS